MMLNNLTLMSWQVGKSLVTPQDTCMNESKLISRKDLRITVLTNGTPSEADVSVARALAANGYQTFLINPYADGPEAVTPDLYVMTGPFHSLRDTIQHLESSPDITPLIFWYTEPLPTLAWPGRMVTLSADVRFKADKRFSRRTTGRIGSILPSMGRLRAVGEMHYLHRAGRMKLMATYTQQDALFFQNMGLPAVAIPMGSTPSFGCNLNMPRSIDVIFIGSTRDKRRGPIIRELYRKLGEKGIQMVIRDGSQQHGYVYGKERTVLLNRSKIALSIMRQPWDTLVYRTLMSAQNKAMVLSEPVLDAGPFSAGEHFAVSTVSAMSDAIQYYLDNEQERERIATNAYQYVTEELTMSNMARRFLESWQETDSGEMR